MPASSESVHELSDYCHVAICVFFLQICGVIFDSAPGDRRLLSLYRAVSSIYGQGKRFKCLVSWCITLGLAARWVAEVSMANHLYWMHIFFTHSSLRLFRQEIFLRIKGMFSSQPMLSINPYTNLMRLENFTPQMFLYSDSDKLIPAKVRSKLTNYLPLIHL